MKIYVTGAAGMIGSNLCSHLVSNGHEVIGIDDLSRGKMSNLDSVLNNKAFDLQTYKKFLLFLRFQEMLNKYEA